MRERAAVARSAGPSTDGGHAERRAATRDLVDDEPIRIPKQSRAWLWSLLILCAAGIGLRVARPALVSRALHALAPGWGSSSDVSPPESHEAPPAPLHAASVSSASATSEPPQAASEARKTVPKASAAHPAPKGAASAALDVGSASDAGPTALVRPLASGTPPTASAIASAKPTSSAWPAPPSTSTTADPTPAASAEPEATWTAAGPSQAPAPDAGWPPPL
jgi:hypothetical protein